MTENSRRLEAAGGKGSCKPGGRFGKWPRRASSSRLEKLLKKGLFQGTKAEINRIPLKSSKARARANKIRR